MGLINKREYLIKLQEVMEEAYPNTDYTRMSQYVLKAKVKEEMSSYVMKKYGEFNKDKLPSLIKESHSLLTECLEELGMRK